MGRQAAAARGSPPSAWSPQDARGSCFCERSGRRREEGWPDRSRDRGRLATGPGWALQSSEGAQSLSPAGFLGQDPWRGKGWGGGAAFP